MKRKIFVVAALASAVLVLAGCDSAGSDSHPQRTPNNRYSLGHVSPSVQ